MSTDEKQLDIIQYVPFTSFVHPSFWHSLTDLKLNVDKLKETTKQIHGSFSYSNDIGTVFEVDGTSFNRDPECGLHYINITGTLMNKNTIEDFKSIDKTALLNSVGEMIWSNIKMLSWIKNPSALLNCFILSFADLKKFHYYYWFAFPCPSQPTVYLKEKSQNISTVFSKNEIQDISDRFQSLELDQKCYFVVIKENSKVVVKKLHEFFNNKSEEDIIVDKEVFFAFADPSNNYNPGWSLRIFLAALYECFPTLTKQCLQVIGIRCTRDGSVEKSLMFMIEAQKDSQTGGNVNWLGWERNDRGNFGPKLANMSASMDPIKLAETSSDLNIKLMQWRLVPDLDVDVMKNTKCLLLGAGTLGCHVARDLLAWGFRHITFIDSGKVSYSNPTRQVLFNFQDCVNGSRKAEAAANNMKLILPTVHTEGLVLHIPMPGHPIGEALKKETIHNIEVLTEAITKHDVVFLLLDTREARWLPTLIAASYGKIVINAALGFDSYLVMRHGVSKERDGVNETIEGIPKNDTHVDGGQLGCYFCNDVTAPGNSLKDRTLDQQCTVTRPGVAAIAGALAVELLVAILQHPLRVNAPALYNLNSEESSEHEGILGPIPHSIRGFLHSFQTVVPTCSKFKQCIACSEVVIDKYREEGIEFLMKVFNSGTFLEDVTGLSELQLAAEMTDVLTFSDEDQENSS
ncbi:Autophagy-specific protein 7 isoform A [Danaus plexippus plexippus]|uniref:Ubiquitin-like modifier-activating enzyme ATG7 n=1 Tax=Danaus plexippus plexippus TaxID=278856 RepID=A0A212F8A5_DANPL|nr:Autophagy-specific protein 7 isoform A [Danaus plexippus plexippus]